jgi:hypothetical protein
VTAHADRLINIPTGRKIEDRFFRLEGLWEQSSGRGFQQALGFGVGPSLDLQVRHENFIRRQNDTAFDLSFNFIAAVKGFTPGISVGVLDGADETREGRRGYLAITFLQDTSDDVLSTLDGEITLGFMGGARWNPFVGLKMPVSRYLTLIAEHDGRRISTGVRFAVTKGLDFTYITRGQQSLFGVALSAKL